VGGVFSQSDVSQEVTGAELGTEYHRVSRLTFLHSAPCRARHTSKTELETLGFSRGMANAYTPTMNTSILKPLHEVALLLTLKPARTDAGRKVQEHVLFRVECSMWIASEVKGLKS